MGAASAFTLVWVLVCCLGLASGEEWECSSTSGVYELNSDCSVANEINVLGDLSVYGQEKNYSQLIATGTNRHFFIDSEASSLSIRWLNMSSGAARRGASIFVGAASQVNISRCVFFKNTAFPANGKESRGGAIYAEHPKEGSGDTLFIEHSIFERNYGFYGGAIHLAKWAARIKTCRFTSNSAAYGGAIYTRSITSLVVESTTINLNEVTKFGGGVMIKDSPGVTFSNVLVYKNRAGQRGGGIYVDGTPTWSIVLKLSNCEFVENIQYQFQYDFNSGGGGLYLKNEAAVSIRECGFVRNEAVSGCSGASGSGCAGHHIMVRKSGNLGRPSITLVNTNFTSIETTYSFWGYQDGDDPGPGAYGNPTDCSANPCSAPPFTGHCSLKTNPLHGTMCQRYNTSIVPPPSKNTSATKNTTKTRQNCSKGTRLTLGGSCLLCAQNTIQPATNQHTCLQCPAGHRTMAIGPRTAAQHDAHTDCVPSKFAVNVLTGSVLTGGANFSVAIPSEQRNVFSRSREETIIYIAGMKIPSLGAVSGNRKVVQNAVVPNKGPCGVGTPACEMWAQLLVFDSIYNASGSTEIYFVEKACPTSEKCTEIPSDFLLYPRKDCQWRSDQQCNECPIGARCPGGREVWALPYFGIFSTRNGLQVAMCKEPSARCKGYVDAERKEMCALGYGGMLCGGCKPGFYANVVGSSACRSCPSGSGDSAFASVAVPALYLIAIMSVSTAFALFLSYLAYKYGGGTLEGGRNRTLGFLGYVCLSLSLLAQGSRKANGNLPEYFQSLASHLAVFQLDLAGPVPPACTPYPFWKHLAVFLLSTVCSCCIMIFLSKPGIRKIIVCKKVPFDQLAHGATIWLFLTYSLMANFAMETMHCVPSNGKNEVTVMASNPNVVCFQGDHTFIFACALIALSLHGLTVPMYTARSVKVLREHSLGKAHPIGSETESPTVYGEFVWKYFLSNSYKPAFFYFYHVEILLLFLGSLCNEFLFYSAPVAYVTIFSVGLVCSATAYVYHSPFALDHRWKFIVRIHLSLCSFLNVLTNYFAAPVVTSADDGKTLEWLAPLSFSMNVLLFAVLIFAFGKFLVDGAAKEDEEINALPQRSIRVQSEIRWSNNPIVNRTTVEMPVRCNSNGAKEGQEKATENNGTEQAIKSAGVLRTDLPRVSVAWYEHFDALSNDSYYECIRTASSWEKPSTADESAEVSVHTHSGQKYYQTKTSQVTWERPEGVPIHVVSRPSIADSEFARSSSADAKTGSLLAATRRRLNHVKDRSRVLAPSNIKSNGIWWELTDEHGKTCYLNTATDEVIYSLPKGWVKAMAMERFSKGYGSHSLTEPT